jgi:N utilization substance protein B
MPSRRRAREFALQALFAVDIGQSAGPAALSALWGAMVDGLPESSGLDAMPAQPDEMDFALGLVRGVLDDVQGLDTRIEAASTNWRLPRMPVVDRNILRVGAFEILHRSDVPAPVVINEALEIAKKFGGSESRAFVNGILDRIAKEAGRGRKR